MLKGIFRPVNRYWQGLSGRDQKALMVLAVALSVFIGWAGIWKPAADFAERAREDAMQARADYIWMKSRENWVRQLARDPKRSPSGNLLTRVNNQARQLNIELKRFEPRGDNRLNVWLESIAFDKVVPWLAALNRAGIEVRQISVDQAGRPGEVNVRLSLEG